MAVLRSFTVTIASPAVFTLTAHALYVGLGIKFGTDGALPTGLVAGTTYYVISVTANTWQVSATQGGAAVNTSGPQSGTHYMLVGSAVVGARNIKLAHTPTWPTKGRPVKSAKFLILVPWRVTQYGGGVSLISKT